MRRAVDTRPPNNTLRRVAATANSRSDKNVLVVLARATGLEPATSGVTGRRSNQLSYTRAKRRASSSPPLSVLISHPLGEVKEMTAINGT